LEKEILKVNNLKKYFYTNFGTVKAINGVSFSVYQGETFGIVGESGSGKSTLAYTILGIYNHFDGEILYRGKNIFKKNRQIPMKFKKEVQIIFQDPGSTLNPKQTIQKILELPIRVHGIKRNSKEMYKKVKELIEIVELPESYLYKYPSMLSGGEKQRVSIARSMAINPSLIVLDEPTSSLDVSVQAKVLNMLIKFQKEFNLTYLFITHDLSVLRNIANRISIMYLGEICEIAPVEVFYENALHPYTQMLLSSIPVITEEEERIKFKKVKSMGEIPTPMNIPSGCTFRTRCPKKMDICEQKKPRLININEKHLVRCHLFSKER